MEHVASKTKIGHFVDPFHLLMLKTHKDLPGSGYPRRELDRQDLKKRIEFGELTSIKVAI